MLGLGRSRWAVSQKHKISYQDETRVTGVLTLTRSVSGEKRNASSWNLRILPGIRRLGKFSRRHEVIKLNCWQDFFGNVSQNFGMILQIFRKTFIHPLFCSNSTCQHCHSPQSELVMLVSCKQINRTKKRNWGKLAVE